MRISKVDPAYRSATQLIAALKRGEYSAVELLEQTIQRIERLDGRINAIVVRYFERARAAAEESDRSLKSGDDRPLLGLPITVKEVLQCRRLADYMGVPTSARFRSCRRCGGSTAPQVCRCNCYRKDQYPEWYLGLAKLQRDLRHNEQSLGSVPLGRWLVRGIGRCAGLWLCAARSWERPKRFDKGASPLLRRLRAQTNARNRSSAGPCSARR